MIVTLYTNEFTFDEVHSLYNTAIRDSTGYVLTIGMSQYGYYAITEALVLDKELRILAASNSKLVTVALEPKLRFLYLNLLLKLAHSQYIKTTVVQENYVKRNIPNR